MTGLERMYRVLMASYPADYLEHREEEMVSTLMAGAKPGQRRPTLREAFDLLQSGLAVRAAEYGNINPAVARRWISACAAAALATITVLVASGPVSQRPSDLPIGFFVLWFTIALVPLSYFVAPRAVRHVGCTGVAASLMGIVAGPSIALAQRTLMVAVAMFVVLVVAAGGHRVSRAGAILVLPAIAWAAACSRAPLLPTSDDMAQPVAWQAWKLNQIWQTGLGKEVAIPSLLAAIVIVWSVRRGTPAIVVGLLLPPSVLTLAVLTNHVHAQSASPVPRPLVLFVIAIVAGLAISTVGLLSTMRPPRVQRQR